MSGDPRCAPGMSARSASIGRRGCLDGSVMAGKFVVNAGWDHVPHLSDEQKAAELARIQPYTTIVRLTARSLRRPDRSRRRRASECPSAETRGRPKGLPGAFRSAIAYRCELLGGRSKTAGRPENESRGRHKTGGRIDPEGRGVGVCLCEGDRVGQRPGGVKFMRTSGEAQ
jgi:hypothetical protein